MNRRMSLNRQKINKSMPSFKGLQPAMNNNPGQPDSIENLNLIS